MLGDELFEVHAIDVLHHHEVDAFVATHVKGADDIVVIKLGDGPGFALEAFEGARGFDLLLRHDLDSHGALESHVLAEVDGTHATLADEFDQLVLLADDEAAPATSEELLRLEVGEVAILIEFVSDLFGAFERWFDAREFFNEVRKLLVIEHFALADDVQEAVDTGDDGHEIAVSNGPVNIGIAHV